MNGLPMYRISRRKVPRGWRDQAWRATRDAASPVHVASLDGPHCVPGCQLLAQRARFGIRYFVRHGAHDQGRRSRLRRLG